MFIPSIVNLLELRYVYEQEIKEAKKSRREARKSTKVYFGGS